MLQGRFAERGGLGRSQYQIVLYAFLCPFLTVFNFVTACDN